jgi:macrolide-specific efflux system membrane fusion protein
MQNPAVRRWLGAPLILAIGASAGWAGARRADAMGPADAPTRWETAVVDRRDIGATVLATGVVRPKVGAQVAVGSRASGVLKKLHVTVGDRVVAGQLLAELDPVEFEVQVKRAEAMLNTATAEREFAEAEYRRAVQLADAQAASGVELSAAQRGIETAQAREREAAAALEAARVQLSYTSIRAPISGVVGSVSTQEGETVAASFSAPTFVTIIDLTRLEVWAYVDETDIGRIEAGQRASFTVDTWPDEAFAGRVTAVRPTAEIRDNVVNYVTLIEIENRGGRLLRPEMTTTVSIVLDGRTDALALRNDAVRRDSGGSYVYVPTENGLERRNVEIGFRGTDFTEALSGIEVGDVVVTGSVQGCQTTATERETE